MAITFPILIFNGIQHHRVLVSVLFVNIPEVGWRRNGVGKGKDMGREGIGKGSGEGGI